MKHLFKALAFPEIIVFTPKKHFDNRGFFFENFNSHDFKKNAGIIFDVLQENISFSNKNILRGLHFQKGKYAQSKLVHVIKGSILDVIVDIRPDSKNFGKWISYILDDKLNESIYVPSGFAHGFVCLSKTCTVYYRTSNYRDARTERTLAWNDKTVNIKWPIKKPLLSKKDKNGMDLLNLKKEL